MSAENPKYWGFEDQEILSHDNIKNVVEEYIDSCDCDGLGLQEYITIAGFDPMVIDVKTNANRIIGILIESLDEDYMHESQDYTKVTETMKIAALDFVKKVVAEYHVSNLEEVCRKTIKVKDYL
jgi:hypothetical protein